jgi:hypothetical protein
MPAENALFYIIALVYDYFKPKLKFCNPPKLVATARCEAQCGCAVAD